VAIREGDPKQAWFFSLSTPGDKFLRKVFIHAEQLEIVPSNFKTGEKKKVFAGSLENVIKALKNRLHLDYKKHQKDSDAGKQGYDLSYIITQDGFPDFVLAVLTRMHSDAKQKSTFYGDIIVRKDEKTYVIYSD
jgi:hypothetical protein